MEQTPYGIGVVMKIKALASTGLRLGHTITLPQNMEGEEWVWYPELLSSESVQDLTLYDGTLPSNLINKVVKRSLSGMMWTAAGAWTFQIGISKNKFAFVQVVPTTASQ